MISTPSPIFKIHKIKTENKCRIPERLLDRVEKIMSDSITVTRPIEIKDNSVERVAFDLMSRIAEVEKATGNDEGKKNNP